MSYLTTPEVPEFKKAIISFWCRIPQASMDAAKAEADANEDNEDPPLLNGLVPLVVFGKEGTRPTSSTSSSSGGDPIVITSTWNQCVQHADYNFSPPVTIVASYWVTCDSSTFEHTYNGPVTLNNSIEPGKPTPPSFIAVDGDGHLQIRFESATVGETVMPSVVTGITPPHPGNGGSQSTCYTFTLNLPCINGGGDIPGVIVDFIVLFYPGAEQGLIDAADSGLPPESEGEGAEEGSETYGDGGGDMGTGAIGSGDFDIPALAADTWHHVLVSVDMTDGSASTGYAVGEDSDNPGSRITGTSLMYIAVDDVNYKTKDGSPFPGTNKVYTGAAFGIASMGQAANSKGEPEGPVPSYSQTNMTVPSAAVGIPSVGKYVDRIHKVEMAEFLMWLDGPDFDTGIEGNRRMFITEVGKDGAQHPVNPEPIYIPFNREAIGDPANWEPGSDTPAFIPPLSSLDPSMVGSGNKILKTPDIDFTKCSFNWMMGLNLGKAKGKVTRTGKVNSYWPPNPQPKVEPSSGGGGSSGGTPEV